MPEETIGIRFVTEGQGALAAAEKGASRVDAAVDRLGKTGVRSRQNMQQFGYALSDIASTTGNFGAMVRSAANNIQMMGVGLSGPAFLAITGATVAVAAFADEIEDAFMVKGVRSVDAYKGALSSLLDVQIKAFDTRFAITNLAQLDLAVTAIQNRVAQLNQKSLGAVDSFVAKYLVLPLSKIPGVGGLLDQIAAPGRNLAGIQSALQASNQRAALEETAKQLGLTREQIEAHRELFDIFKNAGIPTTDSLKDATARLNRELLERIRIREHENKVIIEGTKAFRESSRGLETNFANPFGFTRDGIGANLPGGPQSRMRRSGSPNTFLNALGQEQIGGTPKSLSASFVDEMGQLQGAIAQAQQNTVIAAITAQAEMSGVMADFGPAIAGGLATAAAEIISGAATFEQAMGGFLSSLGQSLIQMGAAGLAIKVFVKNPLLAIAAGIALTALGGALQASAAKETDRFTGQVGGLGASGTIYRGRGNGVASAGRAAVPSGAFAASPSGNPQALRLEVVGTLQGRDVRLSQARTARYLSAKGAR
jgi:hypothetical protein